MRPSRLESEEAEYGGAFPTFLQRPKTHLSGIYEIVQMFKKKKEEEKKGTKLF